MQKIIVAMILHCFFIVVGSAQVKTCIIEGDLGIVAPYAKKIFIQYRDATDFARMHMDSSEIKEGKYAFQLKFNEPAGAYFIVRFNKQKLLDDSLPIPSDEEKMFEYFLDEGKIKISTGKFPFSSSQAKGSLADKQYRELNKQLEPIEKELKIYQDSLIKINKQSSAEDFSAVQKKYDILVQEKLDVYIKFLNNKNSHINAHILRYALNFCKKVQLPKVKSFYEKINAATKKESYCKALKDFIDFEPGIDAPSFVRISADNKIIRLHDYGGKYVLLDFWGSWCKPCRERHPGLVEIYSRYRGDNFEIIGIAKDGDAGTGVSKDVAVQRWMDAIKTDGLPWINILYKSDDITQAPLDELYRVISYPSNYLIDPGGKIIAINLSEKDLDAKLAALLR